MDDITIGDKESQRQSVSLNGVHIATVAAIIAGTATAAAVVVVVVKD